MRRQEGDGLQERMTENCFYDCRSPRLSRAHQLGSPDSRHQSATDLGSNMCVADRTPLQRACFDLLQHVHHSARSCNEILHVTIIWHV